VVSGTVLEDTDNNNTGDTPIAGVTVELKDTAGNVVQTTTTDANGNYTFNNVPAGNYTVVETNKPGYTDVGDSDGGNPNSIAVTLTPGATSTGNDFVDERLPGVVSGTVLEDTDNNNTGDTPIAGVTRPPWATPSSKTRTPTACRMPAKRALPTSPCSSRTLAATWCRPRPPTATATTASA